MPIYLLVKSFIKKLSKKVVLFDTPGKFALLKELKRNFCRFLLWIAHVFVILWLKTNDLTNVKSYRPFL